jgi:WD repeat-containing protein 24
MVLCACSMSKPPQTRGNGQATYRAFQAYRCNAEGIRDVKWSPKDGMTFACGTESGAILKWDMRKASSPLLKINAHDAQKGVTSVSWHPDGDHLISGGPDNKLCVWDLSKNADKKQKPKWTVSTPAPVSVVAWRPGLWSATAQGKRAAQVAVSYDDGGPSKKYGISSVHIWDLGRPTIPFKEVNMFSNSPTALLWHEQDLLWTAGQDGFFTQCDIAFAQRVIDRQSLSAIDFSPRGDVLMFLEERVQQKRPRPTLVPKEVLPPSSSYSSSPSGRMLSISRSDSEEDVVGSFLGPRKRSGRRRRPSHRPQQPLSTTPPSGSGSEEPIISLEQSIAVTGAFKPQQVMAIGHIPAAPRVHVYQYLSAHYLETLERELPFAEGGKPMNERIAGIMKHYAEAAESVSQFRLAQTWRILSYAVDLLLTRRSQYHLELRLSRRKTSRSASIKGEFVSRQQDPVPVMSEDASKLYGSAVHTPVKQVSLSPPVDHPPTEHLLLGEELENQSNALTPLARPVDEHEPEPVQPNQISANKLSPVPEMNDFALPPSFRPAPTYLRQRLDSTPMSVTSQESHISSTEGYDFYDIEAIESSFPKAIDVPKKKQPLSLDVTATASPLKRAGVSRLDSDDSLGQMYSVSDGSRLTTDAVRPLHDGGKVPATVFETVDSADGTSEGEFPSRIRGKEHQPSQERSKTAVPTRLTRGDSESQDDIFMISQTTADTAESFDSHLGSHFDSQPASQPTAKPALEHLEIVPPASPRKTSRESLSRKQSEEHISSSITEEDYMPWLDDPPFPFTLTSDADTDIRTIPSPLDPYNLIVKALEFETKRSALNASAMILLLKPLLPDGIIDPYLTVALLRQHHNRLMGQQLFIEAAVLRNLCVRDWPAGIESWGDNYPSIFSSAQQRGSAAFICPKCRKPRDIDHSDPDGPGVWVCESCRHLMAPCAICGHRSVTPASLPPTPIAEGLAKAALLADEPILSTWWYCPGCSHGGHATCIQGWHAPIAPVKPLGISKPSPAVQDGSYPEMYSDGCCPLDGCGHACLPGRWRNESSTARTEELGRAVREQTRGTILPRNHGERRMSAADQPSASSSVATGRVRNDSIEVAQSRAVEGVREALAIAGIGGGHASDREERTARVPGGILNVLSSSPGRISVAGQGSDREGRGDRSERERRKSVKFAGTTMDDGR